MDYLDFGDTIDYNKFNALVYLLRKFKKLTCDLKLGASIIESDYGTFNFSDGFVNVGNNWILEDTVTVTSNDVLKNTFYSFHFTVINVDTSGIVNRRVVTVTGGTGDTDVLVLEIPSDIINSDEVILPDYKCSVVFDEHEYYTPLPDVHLSLSVDKRIIEAGEVTTITGLLTDSTSTPIENVSLPLIVDGTTVTVITDSTGEFDYVYTGTGTRGKVLVSAMGESVFFYDGTSDYVTAVVTGNSITLGSFDARWLPSIGDVVIDWGDGTSDTVNNPHRTLSHTYADGLNEHLIIFDGTVTSLGQSCFSQCSGLTSIVIPDSVTSIGQSCFYGCSGLTSIVIPDSVTSLGTQCFWNCSGLTSVVIPDSVTSLGGNCFYQCSSLTTYDLYWETQPIPYDSYKMPVNTGTVFRIPYGTTSIYSDAGYPVANLVEREPLEPLNTTISISSDKQTIYTDETIIITGTLLDEDNNPVKQASVKLYDGNTLLDTLTTDNAGAYTKTITGLTTGTHTLHTSFEGTSNYNASTSSNIIITVSEHNYNLVLSSDTPIIQTGDSAIVNALLTHNGSAYSSQSLSYTVKHGLTTIDTGTVTTGSDGKASISYNGTGVGDVSVEVSYGTLLQETYEVCDCIAYNKETSTSDFWTYWSSTSNSANTVSVDNTGTTISTNSTMYTATYMQIWLKDLAGYKDIPLCIELDVIESSNFNLIFHCKQSDGTTDWNQTLLTTGHWKINVTNNKLEVYKDNILKWSKSLNSTQTSTFLQSAKDNGNGMIKFKNYVVYPISTNLTLSSDKDILSAHDRESATITALLTEGNTPIEGIELEYSIKHDNTVIDSGTIITDSNGEGNIVYTATGVGDVSVEVTYGTLLQETYAIEDCLKYYPLTDNSHESAFTIPSGTTVSYSDDGMRLSANAYKQVKLTDKLTSDCSVEFTVVDYSTPSYSYPPIIVYAYTNGETTPNQIILISNNSSSMQVCGNTINHVPVKGGKYKIEYTSSNIRVYENNTLLASASNDVGFPTRFEWHTGSGRYVVYKDLKVKAL